ncbi:hypothetical protein [Candidatus Uabimicrobium sp. HlEnr_7]|uniref:hypothetical protein n=1 Tax=Candidatus Uabimicrobium helgolandensis TaxID=3095367 RepID=UPI0035591EBD
MKKLLLLATTIILLSAQTTQEFIEKNAIRVQNELPAKIYKIIKPYRVIILGELHGTNEGPELIYKLSQLIHSKKEKVAVGLEMSETFQKTIDTFFQTNNFEQLKQSIPFNYPTKFQDGRSSTAIALLIKKAALKEIPIICYDPEDWNNRDIGMAKNITKVFQAKKLDKIILLAGNAHALLEKSTQQKSKPMANALFSSKFSIFSQKDILSIHMRSYNTKAWVMLTEIPKIHHFSPIGTVYSKYIPWDMYFLHEPHNSKKYNATFFWRNITASPPLNWKK